MSPVSIQGFRLSHQQARLFANDPASLTRGVVLIEGDLDGARLRRAVEAVAATHTIFQTRFRRVPGMKHPLQVQVEDAAVVWREEHRGAATDPESLAGELLAERPVLDLESGALLHAGLFRIDERCALLELTTSRLCADRRSLDLIFEAVARAYGDPSRETEEVTQHLDFSEWQWEQVDEDEAEEILHFWRRRRGELPAEGHGGLLGARASERVDRTITATAQVPELDAPVAAAIWCGLIHRIGGVARLTLGTECDGRILEDFDEVVGPLAVAAPVPVDLSPAMTAADLVEQISEAVEEAEDHLELALHEAEDETLDLSFACDTWPDPVGVAGLSFNLLRREVGGSPDGLALSISHRDGGQELTVTFDAARIAAERVETMVRVFVHLLEQGLPEVPLDRWPLLASCFREELLERFNAGSALEPEHVAIHQMVAARAARVPEETAVRFGEVSLTYGDLIAGANRLANYLIEQGIGPESRVAVCLPRGPELVTALLAIHVAGGAYVALDPRLPEARKTFVLEDAQIAFTITDEVSADAFGARVLVWERDSASVAAMPDTAPGVAVSADNLAYLIYTSGSTGVPKGVLVPHGGLMRYLTWAFDAYRAELGGGVPLHASMSFDMAMTSLYLPLMAGKTVTLVPEDDVIEGLSKVLETPGDFSLVKLTPSHLKVLERWLPESAAAGATSALVLGGEALYAEDLVAWLERAPKARLVNEYGPTETVVGCCFHEVTGRERGPVPIGRPVPGARLYVIDPSGQPVPPECPGELVIGGAMVTRGYHGRPGLTADRFRPDPFGSEPGARLYHTGDQVRFTRDEALVLQYLGRNDNQVKIRGYRIELGEIETALKSVDGVTDAVVIARADEHGDKRLVAYTVGEEALHADTLRERLAMRLPEHMLPSAFVSLPELPLAASGKVDLAALPEPSSARDLAQAFVAPRTPEETAIAEAWQEALGVDRVGIHDNFFSLGGDSIRSVQAVALTQDKGLEVTMQQLFRFPTIAQLAENLGATIAAEDVIPEYAPTEPFSLVSDADRARFPEEIEDAYPLGAVQLGMLFHMQETRDTPSPPIYHNLSTFELELEDTFSPELFQEAVDRLVARHPMFRTSFDLTTYSEPLSLIHRHTPFPVPVHDLRDRDEAERKAIIDQFVREENFNLFDITVPSLVRLTIHWLEDKVISLSLTEPHAISDGWSTHLNMVEIFEDYLACKDGEQPAERAPLEATFRDFISLEKRTVAAPAVQKFWASRMEAYTTTRLPALPRVYRSDASISEGKSYSIIPLPLVLRLHALAKAARVPVKTVFLAGHLRVLGLLTGQRWVTSGLVFNGRPEIGEGADIRGLFLNTLPITMALRDEPWLDWIARVYEEETKLVANRRYPVGLLQSETGRRAAIHGAFAFHNFHSVSGILGSERVKVRDTLDLSGTNFDLNVVFTLSPVDRDHAILLFQGSLDRLTKEQLRRFHVYYEEVFAQMTRVLEEGASVGTTFSESFLPADERSWLLEELNATEKRFDAPESLEALVAAIDSAPDRVAGLADALRAEGVGPETPVGLALPIGPELVTAVGGVLAAGGAVVHLPPAAPRHFLSHMIADSGLTCILTNRDCAAALPQSGTVLVMEEIPRAEPVETVWPAEQLAEIAYPLGVTGPGHGVMRTRDALRERLLALRDRAGLSATDRVAIIDAGTESIDLSMLLSARPAALGEANVLMIAQPRDLADLDRRAVDTVICPHGGLDFGSIRALTENDPRRWVFPWLEPEGGLVAPDAATRGDARTVMLGRPGANCRVVITALNGALVPAGTDGELFLGGAGLARGYHGSPARTALRFRPDPHTTEPGMRLFATDRPARYLPDGQIELSDPLETRRRWRLREGEGDPGLGFWQALCDESPPALPIAGDRGESDTPVRPMRRYVALADAAAREAVTAEAFYLAAFAVLISRYGAQSHVMLRVRGAELMGAGVADDLPFPLRLRDDEPFIELARRVEAQLADVRAHGAIPFDELLRLLELNAPEVGFAFGAPVKGCHLGLSVARSRAALVWDGARYDVEMIEALLARLVDMIALIAAEPDRPVGRIPSLDEKAQRALTAEMEGDSVALPEQQTVHALIDAVAAEHGTSVAAVAPGEHELEQHSFSELVGRANQLAHVLIDHGVGPESVVGLAMDTKPATLIAILATLKAGGAYLPINPGLPAERVRTMLDSADARVVLADPGAEGFGDRVVLIPADLALETKPERAPEVRVHPDQAAYIIFTSGSSGVPKGVVVTHRNAVGYLDWARRTYVTGTGDGAPVHSPLGFDLTVTSLFVPLISGRPVTLLPFREGLAGVSALLEAMGRARYDFVKLTPSHLELATQLMSAEQTTRTPTLVLGGEALSGRMLEPIRRHAPAARLINEYGPTETTVGCCYHEVGVTLPRGAVPLGRPIANARLRHLDHAMRPVPLGRPGELLIGGVGVARGYVGRPGQTAAVFVPDPEGSEPGGRLYKTGDTAVRLATGELIYRGRADSQVKILGHRIEPGEIEAQLARHASVSRALVTVIEEAGKAVGLAAYLVPIEGETVDTAAIRADLTTRLPDYMIPRAMMCLADIPLTANGKPDLAALPDPERDRRAPAGSGEDPRNQIEGRVAEIWQEVLGIRTCDLDTNFADLGGHSFHLLQILLKLRLSFEKKIEVVDLFAHPTVRELAAFLAREDAPVVTEEDADAAERRAQAREMTRQRRRVRRARPIEEDDEVFDD